MLHPGRDLSNRPDFARGSVLKVDSELLHFYSTPGLLTDLTGYGALLVDVPTDRTKVRRIVASSLLHPSWAKSYRHRISAQRSTEQQLRHASDIAEVLNQRSMSSLVMQRSLGERAVGTCRNFTVFYVAILRSLGIASRARCGHASYFEKGKWVDHWVAEVWSFEQERWVRSDPQLDDHQLMSIGVDWSPDDLPPGAFLSAGECWAQIRDQTIDPKVCGIYNMWGDWFVRSNVVRDLASLNKIELLPWDGWGLIEDWTQLGSVADNAIVDRLAEACASNDFQTVEQAFAQPGANVPNIVTSFLDSGPVKVLWTAPTK